MYMHGSFGDTVGSYITERVKPMEGKPYVFGGKSATGRGVDCSGLMALVVLPTMQAMNQRAGGIVYDMAEMNRLMHTTAAEQIHGFNNLSGGYVVDNTNYAGITPGTLIGITRNNVPGFAAGRYDNISHVAVAVVKDGQIQSAQSSDGGTQFTPLKQFLSDPTIARAYAVDPFKPKTEQGKQLLARLFNGTTNDSEPRITVNTPVASTAVSPGTPGGIAPQKTTPAAAQIAAARPAASSIGAPRA
jgi:hypothetical protein